MARIITTYIVVLLLVSLGFFGVGAIASARELHEPMQPPPDYFIEDRKITVIDDQMLAISARIR